MKIEQIYTKCLAEAAYYIESNGEVAIIDPLRETDPYLDRSEDDGAKIKYIFETHFHADFVSGHVDLAKKSGAKIIYGPTAKTSYDIHEAKDGEEFILGDIKIVVMHTPGHTPESSTFLLIDNNGKDHAIFTGDTLFIGDVGRPDLAINQNVSKEDLAGVLYDSIRAKIMPLADSVIVYPAHGAGSACGKNMSSDTFSTLGEQKASNYALQDITREEFVKQVTECILPLPQYFPKNVMLNKMGCGSIDEVMKKGSQALSVEKVEEEMAGGAIVVDARSRDEFRKGFIPGSINIGLDGSFAVWAGTLVQDINTRIIIVVEDGRAKEAVMRLARIGYDNTVGYLADGINGWRNCGKPLEQITSISAGEFERVLAQGEGELNVLDVRKPEEFQQGHVKIAKSYPLDSIHDHKSEIGNNNTYYLYCKSGYRSMIACSILKAMGHEKIIDVAGGFDAISGTGVQVGT
ncbi:MAG: MBL fold metallo-hydrolase [Candidatus Anammoxibacter sp.]